MTREDAIDVLKHNYPSACFTDLRDAVEIAIQALSAQLTLDELKAEAKRQGYKLIKDNPIPKFNPCICGANHRTEWKNTRGAYCYECMECGRTSSWGDNRREARENWNRMVTDEAGRTYERP